MMAPLMPRDAEAFAMHDLFYPGEKVISAQINTEVDAPVTITVTRYAEPVGDLRLVTAQGHDWLLEVAGRERSRRNVQRAIEHLTQPTAARRVDRAVGADVSERLL